MANLTSNGTQIPLALKLAKPPYTQPTHTNKTFVDDYNRTFPGNAESASDLLGVQCWSSSSSVSQPATWSAP